MSFENRRYGRRASWSLTRRQPLKGEVFVAPAPRRRLKLYWDNHNLKVRWMQRCKDSSRRTLESDRPRLLGSECGVLSRQI